MIPAAFEYHRPGSVKEAVALLAKLGEEAHLVAGGHSLIPMMKLRMAAPEHLVDLRDIADLKGIKEESGALVIGALSTQEDVIGSDLLAKKCPILRETALQISDPQVRAVGTLGGNVANGDPGNDMPAVMMALNARFVLQGGGSREVAAREFFFGPYDTAREHGEVLTAIRIPTPAAGHGYAYMKQKRKTGDYATAAAAVVLTMSRGKCDGAAIALTNVGDTALYAEAASESLVGSALDAAAIDEAARLAEGIAEPVADDRGPADFRTRIAGVMVRRAIASAKERAA
ncbi:MAG: xanthine dehydrogenase family protein subunit M [Hyphomicrobiales bacterium]|nr:xanthine dehydrogenase family protein subunit M [Hyphomicrobiales bacterium]